MRTDNAERMRLMRQNEIYRDRERLAQEVSRLKVKLEAASTWQFMEGFNAARNGRAFNPRASAEWRDGFWTGRRAVERSSGISVVSPRLATVAADRRNTSS